MYTRDDADNFHRPAEQPARTRSHSEYRRTLDYCRGRLLVRSKFSLHEDWLWVSFYRMFLVRRCFTELSFSVKRGVSRKQVRIKSLG